MLVAVVAGTGLGSTSQQPTAAKRSKAPLVPGTGGTVTVDVPNVPSTLNPHTVAGDSPTTEAVADAIWPQVFRTGPGLVPQLDTAVVQSAEVVGVSPQTVVYQINPRAIWSDGTPITAADFVYAWKSQSGSGAGASGTPNSVASDLGYRDISAITATNHGRTVRVVFRTPYADWARLFASLLPAQVATRAGWNTGFNRFHPSVLVSGGPWMVQAWTPGQSLVLQRNPRWWGIPPPLDAIVLQKVPSPAAAAANVVAGRAQVMAPSGFDAATLAAASSDPKVMSSVGSGTTLLELVMNTRRPPLALASARHGIAHLIGRTSLLNTVAGPVAPGLPLLGDHLMSDIEPGYVDNGAHYLHANVAAAKRDLLSAGFTRSGRTWDLAGSPLTLTLALPSDDPWAAASGAVIARQLQAQGVAVTTVALPAAQLTAKVLRPGSFDLALVPMHTGAYVSQTARWWAPGSPGGGTSVNWSGLDDPRVIQLYHQASQQLNAARAQVVYQQIDQVLWHDMAALPLFSEPTLVAHSAHLSGVQADPGGAGVLWSSALWAPLVPGPKGASPAAVSTTSTTIASGAVTTVGTSTTTTRANRRKG